MADVYFTRTMAQINPLLDKADADYTKAEIDALFASKLNGVKIEKISKEDYDSLAEKDENTLYIVENDGKVEIDVGDTKATGEGNVPQHAVQRLTSVGTGIIGDLTEIEEE